MPAKHQMNMKMDFGIFNDIFKMLNLNIFKCCNAVAKICNN